MRTRRIQTLSRPASVCVRLSFFLKAGESRLAHRGVAVSGAWQPRTRVACVCVCVGWRGVRARTGQWRARLGSGSTPGCVPRATAARPSETMPAQSPTLHPELTVRPRALRPRDYALRNSQKPASAGAAPAPAAPHTAHPLNFTTPPPFSSYPSLRLRPFRSAFPPPSSPPRCRSFQGSRPFSRFVRVYVRGNAGLKKKVELRPAVARWSATRSLFTPPALKMDFPGGPREDLVVFA